MTRVFDFLLRYQSRIYRYFLYVLSLVIIVWLFPEGGKFKYEYELGKPWQYEDYFAPFNFAIRKLPEEYQAEVDAKATERSFMYQYKEEIFDEVLQRYNEEFEGRFAFSGLDSRRQGVLFNAGEDALQRIYAFGYFEAAPESGNVKINRDGVYSSLTPQQVVYPENLDAVLEGYFQDLPPGGGVETLMAFLRDVMVPNALFDKSLTDELFNDDLAEISRTRGAVLKGAIIIRRGKDVDKEAYKKLESIRQEYESELYQGNNRWLILVGYGILVALALLMLYLFLERYRPEIYKDNNKITFILINMVLMVLATTAVVKWNVNFIYAVPFCIMPLVLKNFFDARLGLFVHVLTLLILGFVVPNSFEYIFLQITAGIVTILGVTELYKRANLFVAVGQITLIYLVGYFAFNAIHEGSLSNFKWLSFASFGVNGMLTLFVLPLIYGFERIFGLTSDSSLLELSDTNSALLKQLSDAAPGTFHHSLQVANLAEAAANEIGANALLTRVGALYHDIGKLTNPAFFTENQTTNINPHDDLPPKESARIILDHVIKGIEMARKERLPDRVIDFLRTHHGTSLVYYFYKKQQEIDENANEADFRYPGPIPFSKETAILMMADSVEAASKSLKSPTYTMIDEFVEKIVTGQMRANQFSNANITFKEIEQVKKVLKQKLTNIYHLRVEYPE